MKEKSVLIQDQEFISNALKLRFHPITVTEGKGCYLFDENGRSFLDLTAGWAVANIGYGQESVAEKLKEQYIKLSFTTQLSAPSQTMTELAEKLIEMTPGDFSKKVWFGHSGSDANDLISKLVPAASGRPKMIAFMGAYHGQTMGALSLSGHSAQAKFEGKGNVIKLPYPNPYRPFSGISEHLTEQTIHFMNEVFSTICPPEETAGIIVEAIQSDGGVILPPDDFLAALRQICDQHGIYLIVDEVKVGMGRTGKWFSFEHSPIIPDAVVLGKSLGGGLPISAVIGRQEILDSVTAGHMFTASGNPLCTAAAIETIRIIEEKDLISQAEKNGQYFLEGLRSLQKKYPFIGEVRGKGLVLGVEIVTDRLEKKPDPVKTSAICYRAYELGLLIYYVGIHGNVLEITPPLTISREEITEALHLLDQTLQDVAAGHVDWEQVKQFSGWA
ncbi:aspartate aminotransferase family protein [Pseudobacillus wudalianchiensis]|uniref:Aminotransferase class III n=1 Tax=Pseudobacillus wudalianchiensis TaxID=1743143 RepID=A0A1B9AXU0_9BACI|nr:aspartate aminotransferase family protein [Bacillus wudalianchiensis]OCA88732.1 aminotransferase class III [Bacillus wudalianchiensis]